jgi:hypothetical protein
MNIVVAVALLGVILAAGVLGWFILRVIDSVRRDLADDGPER